MVEVQQPAPRAPEKLPSASFSNKHGESWGQANQPAIGSFQVGFGHKKTTADGTDGYSNFESENFGYSITLRGVSTPYGKVERSGEKGKNLT